VADLGDVKAAGGNIGGHQYFKAAVSESSQSLFAFALSAVGMQDRHGVVIALEQVRYSIGPIFCAAENNDRVVINALE
jgi:hypothetical protein